MNLNILKLKISLIFILLLVGCAGPNKIDRPPYVSSTSTPKPVIKPTGPEIKLMQESAIIGYFSGKLTRTNRNILIDNPSESGLGILESSSSNLQNVRIGYRELLYPSKQAVPTSNVQGFVIFTHRPITKEDVETYLSVCEHWRNDFESIDTIKEYASKNTTLIPLYWPTSSKDIKIDNPCESNDLYSYDYSRAAVISSLIGREALSDGPLLVLKQYGYWYILDISKFDPVDVKRAFTIWKQQITSVDLTTARFNRARFKEYFRALIEIYGSTIVKVASKAL